MLNFKGFLSKYTTIDERFVDDFYDVIDEKYIERCNSFIIDAEKLRKWLQITTKSEFKKTLANSYKKMLIMLLQNKKLQLVRVDTITK